VLVEISKMQQRYDAVLSVIRDGLTITEAAQTYGVSRQSLYRWMARYEEGGLEALAERSHRPRSCPHQIEATLEERIITMRRSHPAWGPLRIAHRLAQLGVDPAPSHMAVYRAVVRHHLIEPKGSKKRLPTYKRWERGRPMELWQMDVVGGVLLEDGTECKILTRRRRPLQTLRLCWADDPSHGPPGLRPLRRRPRAARTSRRDPDR
jgi:transposase